MKFDSEQRDAIIIKASQIHELLGQVDEIYWQDIINRATEMLRKDEFHRGTQILKSMYGGMGSINDLYISPVNGHNVAQKDIEAVNIHLRERLSNLYLLINR